MARISYLGIYLLVLAIGLLVAASAFAQHDPIDQGAPDWAFLIIESALIDPDDSGIVVDLRVANDVQELSGVAVGMHWDNPNVRLDSMVWSQAAQDAFEAIYFLYDSDIDSTNLYQQFMFVGVSITVPHLPVTVESHLMASYYFSDDTWGAGDSCCIDSMTWDPSVQLKFVDAIGQEYTPWWGGPKCAWAAGYPTECFGTMGNVMLVPECDSTDQTVDIVDLQLFLDHQFLTLTPLCWDKEADLDFSGDIDITDVQLMIDYQFLSLDPFPACP